MTAISVSYTAKDSNRIAVGKPVTTGLWHDNWDSIEFLKQWVGQSYYAGAVQDHDHDGTNSKPITLTLPFWRDFGDGNLGAITHSSNGNISAGLYNYTDFTINSSVTLTQNVAGPLVIRCTGTATINGTIAATGLTWYPYAGVVTVLYPHGPFGGSGGGSADNQPGSNSYLTPGGTTAVGSTPALAARWTAIALNGPFMGGAPGALYGGGSSTYGGGAVFIIARTINFTGSGVINVSGANGGGSGDGGSGGGVIVLSAQTYTADAGTKTVSGGSGTGGGWAGGAGWTMSLTV